MSAPSHWLDRIPFFARFRVNNLTPVLLVIVMVELMSTILVSLAIPNCYVVGGPTKQCATLYGFTLVIEWIILTFASACLLYKLVYAYTRPSEVIALYLTTMTYFSAFYRFCFLCDRSSMTLPAENSHNKVWPLWVAFQYFSATTFTTTGLGDISPTLWITKITAATQMLLSGQSSTFDPITDSSTFFQLSMVSASFHSDYLTFVRMPNASIGTKRL